VAMPKYHIDWDCCARTKAEPESFFAGFLISRFHLEVGTLKRVRFGLLPRCRQKGDWLSLPDRKPRRFRLLLTRAKTCLFNIHRFRLLLPNHKCAFVSLFFVQDDISRFRIGCARTGDLPASISSFSPIGGCLIINFSIPLVPAFLYRGPRLGISFNFSFFFLLLLDPVVSQSVVC